MQQPIEAGSIPEDAEQVMVAMRDGIRLATDLYLPEAPGRLPTVLVRLPYDKDGGFSWMPEIARHFVGEGYAVVIQDVRGKFRSEGETFAFVHEVEDGWDTLEWIVAQPWSNGRVGTFGDSYYGFTQWASLASGHPALVCAVPRMTTTLIGRDWMWRDGVSWLFTMLEWAAMTWIDQPLYEGPIPWEVRPLTEVIPRMHGGRRSASFDRWTGLGPDDPWWTDAVFAGRGNPVGFADVPLLHSGGWWDVFQRGQLWDFARMRGRAGGQHLVMNASDHWDQELRGAGEPLLDFTRVEADREVFLPRYLAPATGFFARYLRADASVAVPDVRWHLANDGWREASVWPPPGAREERWFLTDAAHALGGPEGGGLTPGEGERSPGTVTWTHDPADLVPTLTEDAWACLAELPDERLVETRPDVATFTSDALPGPLDLVGPAAVSVSIETTGPSTHLMAKLVDVAPDGRAQRVADGALLTTGGPASVDLGHVGYRFGSGHRLRLELASSCFPRFAPHPGTGEDPMTATPERSRVTEQRVRIGGTEAASLHVTTISL